VTGHSTSTAIFHLPLKVTVLTKQKVQKSLELYISFMNLAASVMIKAKESDTKM
jgi:hypothetical protein